MDSPVIAGEYFRTIDLTPGEQPPHFLHLVADSAAALEMKPEDIRHFAHLVKEENALFGAHHYRDYHFLLTLSDRVAHFGLEHHESSDNRQGENYLTDAGARQTLPDLLPHEMVHSWNGKYRRPAGLATPDYQQPMLDELLWDYEGLTDYLGKVLAARSGLQTNEDFRETFALIAAMLDHRAGRSWRSLADTTVAAQLLYFAPSTGTAWRRGTDFYPEGDLIWLEADTLIRQQTKGKRSLDDFCAKFYGGESGPPKVVPYTYDDVVKALNEIAPYDWRGFFQQRIYEINPHAPLGGIENAGWRLVYTNELPALLKTREGQRKYTDLSFSLGLSLGADGSINDVLPGTPGDVGGHWPGHEIGRGERPRLDGRQFAHGRENRHHQQCAHRAARRKRRLISTITGWIITTARSIRASNATRTGRTCSLRSSGRSRRSRPRIPRPETERPDPRPAAKKILLSRNL